MREIHPAPVKTSTTRTETTQDSVVGGHPEKNRIGNETGDLLEGPGISHKTGFNHPSQERTSNTNSDRHLDLGRWILCWCSITGSSLLQSPTSGRNTKEGLRSLGSKKVKTWSSNGARDVWTPPMSGFLQEVDQNFGAQRSECSSRVGERPLDVPESSFWTLLLQLKYPVRVRHPWFQ